MLKCLDCAARQFMMLWNVMCTLHTCLFVALATLQPQAQAFERLAQTSSG